jgi:hypothetical protein
MKLSDIILNEGSGPRQKVVDLNSISYDLLISMFGTKPMFGFSLPNPDDSSRQVFDQESLDSWKAGIEKKYGNVNIKIDVEASSPWEKIQVLDDKFRTDKKQYSASKGDWLDKEREAGRTSGLD